MQFDRELRLADLIARKAAGKITDEEQTILDGWVAESPDHMSAHERVMSGESLKMAGDRETRLNTALTISNIEKKVRRREKRPRRIWAAASAAAVFAGVILGLFIYDANSDIKTGHEGYAPLISFNGGEQVALQQDMTGTEWEEHLSAVKSSAGGDAGFERINVRIEIPRGGDLYKLKLGDGSMVWLNSGTVIEYPESFTSGKRNVRLDGEAFFEVAENREKPFMVSTAGDVTVEVLGTSFNITAYGEDDAVATTLVSGSVEVATATGTVRLVPGQKAVVEHGTDDIIVDDVDPSLYHSWTTGVFDFEGEKLSDICTRLARWYDVEFEFEGVSGNERFSGRAWMNAPLEDFLNNIELATDVTFKRKQGKILVMPK